MTPVFVLAAGALGAAAWFGRDGRLGIGGRGRGALRRGARRADEGGVAHFARGAELAPLVVPRAGRGRLVVGSS
ncbi:MAG TPA: hypothetical protein VKW77_04295, partial [Acidimicrobiales bacterium]|nr:hypothetical protein [Acidimicrobiales bacterium]